MAKIQFVVDSEVPDFVRGDNYRTSEHYADVPAEERDWKADPTEVGVRNYFPGSSDEMQLIEVRMAPGFVSAPHAHHEDEILYVLEGEMYFGAITCRAGSAISIPKLTLYGFRAGPEGVRYLNVRPVRTVGVISKERLRELTRNARAIDPGGADE